jgi:hypothetical protein
MEDHVVVVVMAALCLLCPDTAITRMAGSGKMEMSGQMAGSGRRGTAKPRMKQERPNHVAAIRARKRRVSRAHRQKSGSDFDAGMHAVNLLPISNMFLCACKTCIVTGSKVSLDHPHLSLVSFRAATMISSTNL